MSVKTYKLAANHHPEDLEDGTTVGPGDQFKADPEKDPQVKRLVEEGKAFEIESSRRQKKDGDS